jgi:hypothetical protein
VGHYWVLSLVVSLLLLALTVVTWVLVRSLDDTPALQPRAIAPDLLQRSRTALLRTLRYEYTRRLTHSLQGAAMLVLGLHERTDVTRSTAQLVFSRSGVTGAQPLPPGTSIVQAYDEAAGGLLVLGEPGAGKTTLLLDLASELLTRAAEDPAHPVPVILNLSSWASKKPVLAAWLIDQLQLVYSVPARLGQAWLEQDHWLLLLDGLDEVEESAHAACIEAINTYRGAHFVPLVVCARSRAYLAQEARLALPSAVEVQPLQEQQVFDYLKRVGKPMEAVHAALHSHPILRQLISTPLMLSVVTLTYRDKAVEDLPKLGTATEQQQQIFERYVERVLAQQATKGHFTPQQTRQWLTWLAQRMQQYSLTEFYLERLQPTWLATKQSQTLYTVLVKIVVGLVFGLVFGLAGGLLGGLVFGLVSGLVLGLVFGLVLEPSFRPSSSGLSLFLLGGMVLGLNKEVQEIRLAEVPVRSWRSFWSYLAGGLVGALSFGLIFGLVGGLIGGLAFGLLGWLLGGLVGALVGRGSDLRLIKQRRIRPNQGIQRSGRNAPRMRLVFGRILGLDKEVQEIRLAEVLAWSWRGFWRSLVGGLVSGLVFGLVSGLVGGLVFGLLGGLAFGLVSGLVSGLIPVLFFGLFGGLIGGVSGLQLIEQLRIRPNQGIQRSGRNALRMGLLYGLLYGLLGGLLYGLVSGLVGFRMLDGLVLVLVFGLVPVLVGGLVGGLAFGGAAYLQHYLLRWILWRSRALPWHYVRFLEEATERILLQRVGGGYRFIHPLFLEHFAAQGTEAPPDPVLQSSL